MHQKKCTNKHFFIHDNDKTIPFTMALCHGVWHNIWNERKRNNTQQQHRNANNGKDDRTDDIFLVPQDKWKQFTCTFCTLKPCIPNGNSRDMIWYNVVTCCF